MTETLDRPVAVTQPVGGVLHGRVSALSEMGVGYIVEDKTDRLFAVARKFVDPAAFDALKVGQPVAFQENGHSAVAVLVD